MRHYNGHYNGSNTLSLGRTQRTSARETKHLRWYAHSSKDRMVLEEWMYASGVCEFNTYSEAYTWQEANHDRAERLHGILGLNRLKKCVNT